MTVFAYGWFTIKASDWRIAIRREMNDSDTEANTKAIDSLLNFETVKYFGNETMEAERFDRSMARYEKAATQTWTSLGWLNFGQGVIFSAGMGVTMVMSALEVRAGTQTLGDFVFINAMLMQLSVRSTSSASSIARFDRASPTWRRCSVSCGSARRFATGTARRTSWSGGGHSLRGRAFQLRSRAPHPEGVSFEVPAGKSVAIVGPSGAGKSTISRLLFRFYDVQSGRITIDGQDIASVRQASVRAAIGIVPQDTVLFNDTIAYNIRYGRTEAAEDEVKQAAALAQVAHFIEALPDGYGTMVGERGSSCRVARSSASPSRARFLKSPPILSSTRQRPRSIPIPNRRSRARSSSCRASARR